MRSSTGVVMQIDKRHAFIMTNSGEFLKIKIGKSTPSIGEIYTGEVSKETPFYKYAAAAASLAFVLFSGTASYAYYTPTSSVVIDINPSIELKVNRWDKIIKAIPLNTDGERILTSLEIKNKSLNDGLDLIVEEAKKDNFINDDYIESGKIITVSVENNKSDKKPNLSKFEEHIKKNNLKVNIIGTEKDTDRPNNPADNSKKGNPQNNSEEKSNNGNKDADKSKSPNDKGNLDSGSDKNGDKEKDNKNNVSLNSSNSISNIIKRYLYPKSNNSSNNKSDNNGIDNKDEQKNNDNKDKNNNDKNNNDKSNKDKK